MRLAFKDGTVPLEVPLPVLTARIEEADDIAGLRIDAGQIRSLVKIAWHARVRAVFMNIRTVVDLRNDVIELERQVVMYLGHLAVFAAMVRACADQVGGSSVHVDQEVVFFSLPRILAFRMDRTCPTWT